MWAAVCPATCQTGPPRVDARETTVCVCRRVSRVRVAHARFVCVTALAGSSGRFPEAGRAWLVVKESCSVVEHCSPLRRMPRARMVAGWSTTEPVMITVSMNWSATPVDRR